MLCMGECFEHALLTCCGPRMVGQVKEAHHCHTCQACVIRRDHHCLWIANCVGFRNAALFLSFYTVFLVTTSASVVALTCLLVMRADNSGSGTSFLGWLVVAIGCVSLYMFGDAYFTTIDLWSHGITCHEDAALNKKTKLANSTNRLRAASGVKVQHQDIEHSLKEKTIATRQRLFWLMLTRNAVSAQAKLYVG